MTDVNFYFTDEEYNDECWKHGGWIGKYTIGNISWRGTRLWFRPPFVKSFDTSVSSVVVNKCCDELAKGENKFPGDCCNLRGDSLEEILQELKGENKHPEKCKYITNVSNMKQFSIEPNSLKYDEILVDADPYDSHKIWLIENNHKGDILNELEYVLNRCDDEGVLWIWI